MGLSRYRIRLGAVLLVVLLLIPAAVSAVTYTPQSSTGNSVDVSSGGGLNSSNVAANNSTASPDGSADANADVEDETSVTDRPLEHPNLTLVTTQGTETGNGGGAYAIDPETDEVVWASTEWGRVFDIDPLSNSTVLLSANVPGDEWEWKAVRFNWRTGEVYETVPIPDNTHDVDYLGDHRYVVAEKGYSAKSHKKLYERWEKYNREHGWISDDHETTFPRAYIVNASSGEITWQYHFVDHYDRDTNGDDEFRDWSHLNDVDVVKNGSAVLLSPRNFDRVVLVNKSTKETEWTLGEENNYDYLNEQHNPELLDTDPPTVLVADSHNDRIVEYVRTDGEWIKTWVYEGNLDWPRDADRLPNGNTLIVDTNGNRILEVTPDKRIVWELNVRKDGLGGKPYDIERVRYGDEPAGPPIHEILPASKLNPEARSVSLPGGDNASATEGTPSRNETASPDDTNASGAAGTTAASRDATTPESDSFKPLSPIESTYNELFTLSAWVLPLWVGKLEFALLNLAVVVAVVWAVVEVRFWWRRRD